MHVLLLGVRMKYSGQAHEKVLPPGAIRQRWEQPPLLSPHGLGPAEQKLTVLRIYLLVKQDVT